MTHPQILHQVVKYAQALWVLTILNVHQRANLGGLNKAKEKKKKDGFQTQGNK